MGRHYNDLWSLSRESRQADSPEGKALHSSSPGGDWFRLPKPGCYLLSLGRPYLFHLSKSGKIRTVALRARGKRRGVSLVGGQLFRQRRTNLLAVVRTPAVLDLGTRAPSIKH